MHLCIIIYKYDPMKFLYPYLHLYICSPQTKKMLPLLFDIKNILENSLSFRRSCRESICGSCTVNINGYTCLSCILQLNLSKYTVYPIPQLVPSKDLISIIQSLLFLQTVIMPWTVQAHYNTKYKYISSKFLFEQIAFYTTTIKYMQTIQCNIFDAVLVKCYASTTMSNTKCVPLLFTSRITFSSAATNAYLHKTTCYHTLLTNLYECILCFCCTSTCPSFWWNTNNYLGPAMLLQLYRWALLSTTNIYCKLSLIYNQINTYRLLRCHQILNCTYVCPKQLDPAYIIMCLKET